MSRYITSELKTALSQKVVRPRLFIEALFTGGPFRIWTGLGPKTINGDVYTGAGGLIGVGEVQETQDTSARGFQVSLSGIPSELLAIALAEDYQGKPCKVIFALLDENENVIGSFCQFDGKMDIMTIQEGPDTSVIAISAESEFITLLKPRVRRYTHEDQQELSTGDKFFEFVAGMQNKPIDWGDVQS